MFCAATLRTDGSFVLALLTLQEFNHTNGTDYIYSFVSEWPHLSVPNVLYLLWAFEKDIFVKTTSLYNITL